MSTDFPSIWCEISRENEKNYLLCGFYREWSHAGIKSNNNQLPGIKIFCSQVEKAKSENKKMILQGDANLCARKWREADYDLSYISDELLSTLALCGLEFVDVGTTYLADRLTEDGKIIESSLDHTYLSTDLKTCTKVFKLDNSSTDHLPILAYTVYMLNILFSTNHFLIIKVILKRSKYIHTYIHSTMCVHTLGS